ncbi:hypothetical protein EV702DRAFT_1025344, partial [Suillus placidus]
AYNIVIEPLLSAQSFPPPVNVPLVGLDPALATAAVDATNVSDQTYRFLRSLKAATNTTHESKIDDFARFALTVIGFEGCEPTVCTRYPIPLPICGEKK